MIPINESNEFDLETFVNLFDAAITSSNPAVQKTLKNLLLLASIIREDQIKIDGPLTKLFNDVRSLQIKITSIDLELSRIRLKEEQNMNYGINYATTGAVGTSGPGSFYGPVGAMGSIETQGPGISYCVTSPTASLDSSNYQIVFDSYMKSNAPKI